MDARREMKRRHQQLQQDKQRKATATIKTEGEEESSGSQSLLSPPVGVAIEDTTTNNDIGDAAATDAGRMDVSFVCLNACATASHLVTLIAKKLDLVDTDFDVSIKTFRLRKHVSKTHPFLQHTRLTFILIT